MLSQSLPWICISKGPVSVSRPHQIVPSTQSSWLLGHFLEKQRLKTCIWNSCHPETQCPPPLSQQESLEPGEVAALRNRWLCLRRSLIGKGPHGASQARTTARALPHINTGIIHSLGGLGATGTNRENPFVYLPKCEKRPWTPKNKGTEQQTVRNTEDQSQQ